MRRMSSCGGSSLPGVGLSLWLLGQSGSVLPGADRAAGQRIQMESKAQHLHSRGVGAVSARCIDGNEWFQQRVRRVTAQVYGLFLDSLGTRFKSQRAPAWTFCQVRGPLPAPPIGLCR